MQPHETLPLRRSLQRSSIRLPSRSRNEIDFVADLPALAETLVGFESDQWGLYGPAGLPQVIVTKLNSESERSCRAPRSSNNSQPTVHCCRGEDTCRICGLLAD